MGVGEAATGMCSVEGEGNAVDSSPKEEAALSMVALDASGGSSAVVMPVRMLLAVPPKPK